MSREWNIYIKDMAESCRKVQQFTASLTKEEFLEKEIVYDAVLRNLTIIGEAAKRVPAEQQSQFPSIEWRKIAGLRDIVIHAYHAIDNDIIWDVVDTEIPRLADDLKHES